MKLNAIIVDDEHGAQLVLENYIGKLNDVILTGKFNNAVEAFHFLKHNKVDVVLLDINMPEINGFALLDMLTHKPTVIFTTAYSDYALKGFEYNAVDYLHKPIRFERFVVAMEKARKWCSITGAENEKTTIELKIDGHVSSMPTADICYIESLGNYIKIHTRNKPVVVLMTMNEIEKKLPGSVFVRIHKSYIVNAQALVKVVNEQVQILDAYLPIGKTYKKYFSEYLKLIG